MDFAGRVGKEEERGMALLCRLPPIEFHNNERRLPSPKNRRRSEQAREIAVFLHLGYAYGVLAGVS